MLFPAIRLGKREKNAVGEEFMPCRRPRIQLESKGRVKFSEASFPCFAGLPFACLMDFGCEKTPGTPDGGKNGFNMSEEMEDFRRLGISEQTLTALAHKGFVRPSAIQEACIPLLLNADGGDVIGQARTGTGKTAAFGIPLIETVGEGNRLPAALVLAPTRELSMQIAGELDTLAFGRRLRIVSVFGGQNIEIQLGRLRAGADVVIGTPGRVLDLMRRGALDWSALRFAVLDEADEMLDMGFIEDMETILAATPAEKRMLMFSATMPQAVCGIAQRFMRDAQVVSTREEDEARQIHDIEQRAYLVLRENKIEALARILEMEPEFYGMVFCRTRADVDELVALLQQRGYPADALHGEIAQAQRTKVIARFKRRDFRILIATDVAARGIDVNDLSHVINFSLPQSPESYVHRIGRTGRAGKRGVAVTFATPAEVRRLERIEQVTGTAVRRLSLPRGEAVVEAKKQRLAEDLAAVVESGSHNACIGFAEELLGCSDHPAEFLAAMIYLKCGESLNPSRYPELSVQRDRAVRNRDGRRRPDDGRPARPSRPSRSEEDARPRGAAAEKRYAAKLRRDTRDGASAPEGNGRPPRPERPERGDRPVRGERSERRERPERPVRAKQPGRLREWVTSLEGGLPEAGDGKKRRTRAPRAAE